MIQPAKIIDIGGEREQLLVRPGKNGECTGRASPDDDEHSTRCQLCGRDDVNSTAKQNIYGKIESFSPWFPEIVPTDPRAQTWIKRLSHRGTALFIHIAISTIVLLFNISVTIYAAARYGVSDGFGDVFQGDCSLVGRYNTLVHLGINIVSTLLLSSSNYCAQLLVAPTRSEVDMAHEKGDWLDIGAPSLRNLWKNRISRRRKAAWTLLMVSSVLLHLVWNSAVFAATPYGSYRIAIVTSDYLADSGPWPTQNNQTLHMLRNTDSLSYLNKTQCIERYVSFTPGQMDVLVVAANITMQDYASVAGGNTSSSLLYEHNNFDLKANWIYAQAWLCSAFARPGFQPDKWCTVEFLLPKKEDWTLREFPWFDNNLTDIHRSIWVKVDHCLSAGVESLDTYCTLRYSAGILVIVCTLNLGKCAAIYYTAYIHCRSETNLRKRDSLVTVGDAVASFLAEKDLTTKHLSFANRDEFTGRMWPTKRSPQQHPGPPLYAIRWFRAVSYTRWLVTLALFIALLTVPAVFLAKGIHAEQHYGIAVDIKSLIAQGLSTPKPYATGLTGLIRNLSQLAGFYVATLYANMWQVLYSGLYLLCNGLLTVMLVADEWNDFIKGREPLRVSSPQGIQRSSYFLSLPYRFAIPLMIASGTIHWLISQSIFVIQSVGVAYGTSFYRYPAYDSSLVGYANIGIIYSLSTGSIMFIALVTLGLCNSYRPRKHDEKQETDAQSYTMPLVSTCSAAISAACHRPDEDSESHLLPVRWGFVEGDYWCFTTSREISYPELGPDIELKVLAETSDNEECHRGLQIDVGPAFQVPIGSQEGSSSHDGASIGEQRAEFEVTSALLPRSQVGA